VMSQDIGDRCLRTSDIVDIDHAAFR
jgi:hypothetical protein